MPLTNTAIRNAKPCNKPIKLFDERGLYLEVSPTGGKWWRLKFRFDGKEKRLSLGAGGVPGMDAGRYRDPAGSATSRATARWYYSVHRSCTMRKRQHSPLMLIVAVLLIPIVGLRLCARSHLSAPRPATSSSTKEGSTMNFTLRSTAFSNGGPIATRYTCDGIDLSPALTWEGVPDGTQSLALIADDPDAPMGTWTHWLLWNIPAKATLLPEDAAKVELLDNGARQGINDFKRIGYGGPCPPPGKPHRYFFKLYALDARLGVKAGAGRDELEAAMKTHILAEAEWMGTYGR